MHNTYYTGVVTSQLMCACPGCYDVYLDPHMSNWEEVEKWLRPDCMDWKYRSVSHYMSKSFMKSPIPPKELLQMDTPFSDMIKYVLGPELVLEISTN